MNLYILTISSKSLTLKTYEIIEYFPSTHALDELLFIQIVIDIRNSK